METTLSIQTLLDQLSAAIKTEGEYHFKQGVVSGAAMVKYLMTQQGMTLDEAVAECERSQNYPIETL